MGATPRWGRPTEPDRHLLECKITMAPESDHAWKGSVERALQYQIIINYSRPLYLRFGNYYHPLVMYRT